MDRIFRPCSWDVLLPSLGSVEPIGKQETILARYPINPPRKKRTREHVLADLSANHVERVALSCGYAVDRVWNDYGLDLALFYV